ncbi:MAG: hypothetical protein ACR2OX_10765, partial [Methyloligellaceae bacterium]
MTGFRGRTIADVPGGTKTTDSKGHLVIPFDDNRLIADLLGEYDANLAIIEDRLGIEAVARGNVVTLKGAHDSCVIAKSVLEGLYARLAEGESIGPGEVEGAIRHSGVVEPGGSKRRRNRADDKTAIVNEDQKTSLAQI